MKLLIALVVTTLFLFTTLGFALGCLVESRRFDHLKHQQETRILPVAWSNVGTCGAKTLGPEFIQWTCRIEQ